jgi:hypothetical protein
MLTIAQLQALKAGILAETDPTFVAYRTNGQTPLIAAWLNAAKVPNVKAWAKDVDPRDTDEATPWTQFDSITQAGRRDSWVHAFMRYPRDYRKASVRKWVTDVWGNATAGSNSEAILVGAGQRNITRAEAILGGSTSVSVNSVSALKLDWEGPLTDMDISAAMES